MVRRAMFLLTVVWPSSALAQSARLVHGTVADSSGVPLAGAIVAVVTVDTLFGASWNEAQFATLSLLPHESPAGVEELHFTPGSPRSVQLAVACRF